MADIVNLRRERKRRKAEYDARAAQTNRLLHGRSKAQKHVERVEKARIYAHLDGVMRESDGQEDCLGKSRETDEKSVPPI